jgi:hypothetical protein
MRARCREVKIALVIALGLLSVAAGPAPADWPSFVPPRSSLAAGVASTIEQVWRHPTFARTVEGVAAPVSLDVYDAFVDAPDVTAAAARHLRLAKYDVRVLDDDWYQASDGRGARGLYRVLVRDRHRRVIVSWGSHSGAILGTVTGSALTLLEFDDRAGQVGQKLTAYVLIDNTVAAALARTLVPVFGGLVDRKLTEGFQVTATVAEWATSRPSEFCAWVRDHVADGERARRLLAAVGSCARAGAPVTRRLR